jgi:maltooligosyltrehalose synthase
MRDIGEGPLGDKVWGNSVLIIPDEIAGNEFNNVFTGGTVRKTNLEGQAGLALREIFANFPVAMLERANI